MPQIKSLATLIQQANADGYWLNEAPMTSWAGECGTFADMVWHDAKLAGLEVDFCDAYDGQFCGWQPKDLPGVTAAELQDLGILKHLNHAWIRHGAKHYDAAHPEGVEHPFDLRCMRQALVELVELMHPTVAARLLTLPWWQQGKVLLVDMIETRQKHPTLRDLERHNKESLGTDRHAKALVAPDELSVPSESGRVDEPTAARPRRRS